MNAYKKEYKFILVGNPNSGKTTLFNLLTGSRYDVGNRIGVTVESKDGKCRYTDKNVKITDLPGIYSLSPASCDESVAYEYILNENPDVIINIIDAAGIERSLYLTLQLSKLNKPMIIALNMIDILKKTGKNIDIPKLEQLLGIPIVPVSARKEIGIDELILRACSCADNYTVSNRINVDTKNPEKCYEYIGKVVSKTSVDTGMDLQYKITEIIDSAICGKFLAIPIFFFVMMTVFKITFGNTAAAASEYLDLLINKQLYGFISEYLDKFRVAWFLKSLILDGILSGAGSVISFFPQIMLLFLCLSFLEDCGYMSRTAFIADKIFAKLGLSGKAIVPLIMGFGCSVPAVMAARTLENRRDRRMTIMLTPFMSCGAKMPIYLLLTSVLFEKNKSLVIFGIYILGILTAAAAGIFFGKFIFKGKSAPLLLELPPYRIPSMRSVTDHVWKRTKEFVSKVGSVLITASVIIWLCRNFDFGLHTVTESEKSILGCIGKAIAPIFTPCGFGDWKAVVSLLTGIAAKEAVVSTMGILYGGGNAIQSAFSPASGAAFLVFALLYTPCMAALGTISNELNCAKYTVFLVCGQLITAWIMSFLTYHIGLMIL